MEQMLLDALEWLQAGWAWLGAGQIPFVLVVGCVVPWLLRTAFPAQWESATERVFSLALRVGGERWALAVRKAVQGIPSLCTGAVLAVLTEGADLGQVLRMSFYAAFSPLLYELLKRFGRGRAPAAGGLRRIQVGASNILLVLLVFLVMGCAGSLNAARDDGVALRRASGTQVSSKRCQQLDDRRTLYGGIEVGGLVLTGASGIAQLPIEELPEDKQGTARFVAAGTALGFAAITAAAEYASDATDQSWAREGCGQ